MEIKTDEELTNQKYYNENKRWVALDDELRFLKEYYKHVRELRIHYPGLQIIDHQMKFHIRRLERKDSHVRQ